ncbi:universal stress protein [Amorphus orientalis]|uniref:Nucleotide-binding universal stress UspA family protein n=1 Tax=Amorphus orientalis TaxID=649198 RepID=A0AAE3VSN5_9HYPH|nr:universal stress protein [Amorphus orientalis]MDQ0317482.1 nucleotide-binding universal stress UspA family protein [Amorphus orientalis]
MDRFKNILVICDGTRLDRDVIDRAKPLAVENGAAVTLVDVVATAPGELARLFAALPGDHAHELEEQIIATHRARLQGLAQPLVAAGISTAEVVRQGTPFIEIIGHALHFGCDFILRSGSGPRNGERALDGLDMHLIRKSPVPFLLWRGQTGAGLKRVLAVVDPNDSDPHRNAMAHDVMKLATSFAAHDAAALDVLDVWHVPEEQVLRHQLEADLKADADWLIERVESSVSRDLDLLVARYAGVGAQIQTHQAKGSRQAIVPEHVARHGIDLVVMGSLSRPDVPGYLVDEDVEMILNRVDCSVLTVKPAGFDTPVRPSAAA